MGGSYYAQVVFLSTPSARRATMAIFRTAFCMAYFYPRPPRGGRRPKPGVHAQGCEFLSTPSARRATPAWQAASSAD